MTRSDKIHISVWKKKMKKRQSFFERKKWRKTSYLSGERWEGIILKMKENTSRTEREISKKEKKDDLMTIRSETTLKKRQIPETAEIKRYKKRWIKSKNITKNTNRIQLIHMQKRTWNIEDNLKRKYKGALQKTKSNMIKQNK